MDATADQHASFSNLSPRRQKRMMLRELEESPPSRANVPKLTLGLMSPTRMTDGKTFSPLARGGNRQMNYNGYNSPFKQRRQSEIDNLNMNKADRIGKGGSELKKNRYDRASRQKNRME